MIARHRAYRKNVAGEMNLPSRRGHREQMNLIIRQRRYGSSREWAIFMSTFGSIQARVGYSNGQRRRAALHNAIYRASRRRRLNFIVDVAAAF